MVLLKIINNGVVRLGCSHHAEVNYFPITECPEALLTLETPSINSEGFTILMDIIFSFLYSMFFLLLFFSKICLLLVLDDVNTRPWE